MANAPENAETLPEIIRNIHKFTAMWIKKNIPGAKNYQKIWWNYWDTCIGFKPSYFARLNYIWHNPVKHKLVEKAEDWKFGSYYYRFRDKQVYCEKLKEEYPFDKIKLEDDF